MARMHAALDEAALSARMLLQVHDELIFEAADAEVDPTMALVKQVRISARMRRPEPAICM